MAFFFANYDSVFIWVESHLLFSATTLHQNPNVIFLVENINQWFFKFWLHNAHRRISLRAPIQIFSLKDRFIWLKFSPVARFRSIRDCFLDSDFAKLVYVFQ